MILVYWHVFLSPNLHSAISIRLVRRNKFAFSRASRGDIATVLCLREMQRDVVSVSNQRYSQISAAQCSAIRRSARDIASAFRLRSLRHRSVQRNTSLRSLRHRSVQRGTAALVCETWVSARVGKTPDTDTIYSSCQERLNRRIRVERLQTARPLHHHCRL